MALLHKLLLAVIPLLAILFALVQPQLKLAGVLPARTPHPAKNIGQCEVVEGLEACEDAWVHTERGLVYLACSSLRSRAHWQPACAEFNASGVLSFSVPPDSLRLFDFSTRRQREVKLVGLPPASRGQVFTHGLDVLSSTNEETGEEELTIFLISHRPPFHNPDAAPSAGADSVIEVFRTTLGASTATWLRTVSNPLVRTPNNLVATRLASSSSRLGFWVTNDHKTKGAGWGKKLEMLRPEKSEIVWCEFEQREGGAVQCRYAAEGIVYPNGIAKGPENLLYSASTLEGTVTVWEIQSDRMLVPVDVIPLNRPIDNLHVSPSTGSILAVTFPKAAQFGATSPSPANPDKPRKGGAAVEVWKVANETGEAQFYGQKYKTEVALADPEGKVVSAITSAVPYTDELLLTGYFTPHAVVCKMPQEL
ncbi:hypothetical protein JCM8547_003624 [Rhodosporidiobolus lusitaniae]